MTPAAVLLAALVALMVAVWPAWRYSRSWGRAPSGAVALVVLILVVLLAQGRI